MNTTKKGRLLALHGPKHCGKSTVAEALVGAYRLRFAGKLKGMLLAMGLTHAQVDGDEKELPCALLGGLTPRHAMQTLGEAWGRTHIDKDVWVRCTMLEVDALLAEGKDVVLDDCRYDNEAQAVRDRGGLIVKLYRQGLDPSGDTHASEAGINARLIDTEIRNGVLSVTIMTVRDYLNYWYE